MLHRYTTLLLGIEDCHDRQFTQNVYLLRNYNQGILGLFCINNEKDDMGVGIITAHLRAFKGEPM